MPIYNQKPRVVSTILSGQDIEKLDAILKFHSVKILPSVSSVMRFLITEEWKRIIRSDL